MQTSNIKLGESYAAQVQGQGVKLVTITEIVNTKNRHGTVNTMDGHYWIVGEDGQKKAMRVSGLLAKDIINAADDYNAAMAEKKRVQDAHEAAKAAEHAHKLQAARALADFLGVEVIHTRYGKDAQEYDRTERTPYVFCDSNDRVEVSRAAFQLLIDKLAALPVGN